ncbi:hypothetical protein BT96DRAFT_1005325 [Gymnopus androsaceus JB14]|uniref:Uncharacterized protein n=1 Tax=Gymnopus androsaceus JB14 TaxID=1447944 RepID=A0A6A4GPP7_9AGAR|nr:hypothetical protein BT96DRAFT_1005325 [Gymnopus androsaceus JB14]
MRMYSYLALVVFNSAAGAQRYFAELPFAENPEIDNENTIVIGGDMAHIFQILSNAFFTFSYDGWTLTLQSTDWINIDTEDDLYIDLPDLMDDSEE